MKELRFTRRKERKCAECGSDSIPYLCKGCKGRRDAAKEKRTKDRLQRKLCISCGKNKIMKGNDKSTCKTCSSIYPNLPIRKLRTWSIENDNLYELMMKKPCTTKELSQIVGVSARNVDRWLFEGASPKKENALKVAEFFGKTIEEVFSRYV
ncbi:helix-turn-helix domain-containing protein [Paenibacillus agilis]|uniref:Helix-turn-helix transcriptional regulator n=1 Tax=Paenibacillus agilis TaxID=3020863 RepID=A0A559IDJ0_9BACL|nr:helix-turn-helix transcriptional regulator [Paenibacillus agilis]TVX85590.1 helix-turn-helix transcriptional regulator [Paenibacillus agilis]